MTLAGELYINSTIVAIVLIVAILALFAFYFTGLTDEEKDAMNIMTKYKN